MSCKLRSGVNWQWALEHKGVKQGMGVYVKIVSHIYIYEIQFLTASKLKHTWHIV